MDMKKLYAVLLALCMLVSVCCFSAFAEPSAEKETVFYVDENGEEASVEATVLGPGGLYGAEGETGWYVLKGSVTCTTNISFYDAVVNVILADDADWKVNTSTMCALNLFSGDLNVYAQENEGGEFTTEQRFGANYGNLHIYGGHVRATGGLHADPSSGKSVTIDGGIVRAGSLTTKDFIVNGGNTVLQSTANLQGDITITGGAFECHGSSNGIQAPNGKVSISGGTANVSGTQNGIYAKELSVTGGDVTVQGINTMGFMARSTTINGGKVKVSGGVFSIYSSGSEPIIFGCPTADVSIQLLTQLNPDNTYAIAAGQTLTDGENTYTGTLTADQVTALTGKTLTAAVTYTPVAAKTPTATENGNVAYYEGSDGKLYLKNGDNYVETTEKDVLVPYFMFTDNGEQLSGYNGADAEIVLPETIPDNYPNEALRGRRYGVVRDIAFSGNTTITKVTMGDNIYHIGQSAFYGCSQLEEIYIGNSLEMIQLDAFEGCNRLKKIYCTSPTTYDISQGHYNWFDFDDSDTLKIFCVKGSILDDAQYLNHTHFIYLPLVEGKEATCTENGSIAYYEGSHGKSACYYNEDGELISYEDIVIPAGHKLGAWVDAVPADCGNDGTLGYYQCSGCSLYFDADKNPLDSIVVPATGAHSFDENWTYADADRHVRNCTVCGVPAYEDHDIIVKGAGDATCGDEGYTGDAFCSVCGERLSEGAIIPPTGNHTITTVNAKEATETETGYTGDEVCTVCGKTIKQGEVIPATGDTTPDEPDDGDACPFCGKVHTGRFAKWIKIVHLVFAFILNALRIIKK